MKKTHFYWIDWLRFIAALMVVVCHARGFNWVDWGRLNPQDHLRTIQVFFVATRPGEEWVVVFFVLSGFLVGGKVIEQSLHNTFEPVNFAIDRISRIWLPLIPALLLTAAIESYVGFPVNGLEMLGNLFALQKVLCDNFAHNMPLWSLSYEVWFYVLAGCAAMVVTKQGRGLWPLAGIVMFFLVFTRLEANFFYCWLLGALCYFLISRTMPGVVWFGLFLAVAGSAISQFQSDSSSMVKEDLWFWAWLPSRKIALLIMSLGVGLLLADICRREPHSRVTVKIEWLGTRLAAFSYTLYLTHYPLLDLWNHFRPEPSPRFDAASLFIFVYKVLSCLVVGWLVYLPFEARTAAVKRWLKSLLRVPHGKPKLTFAG